MNNPGSVDLGIRRTQPSAAVIATLGSDGMPASISHDNPVPVEVVSGGGSSSVDLTTTDALVTAVAADVALTNAALGAQGDAAWTTGSGSLIALVKAIAAKILGTVGVNVTNWPSSQAVTATDLGTTSDAAASSDSGTFSLIALIKRGLAYLAHLTDGTQTTQVIIPSAFKTGQAKIAVTGTAVQLGSNALTQGVLITALSTNAANITIGTSSSLTNTADGTGNGAICPAGSTKSIAATNTNLVWINGTAGDIVSFIGS